MLTLKKVLHFIFVTVGLMQFQFKMNRKILLKYTFIDFDDKIGIELKVWFEHFEKKFYFILVAHDYYVQERWLYLRPSDIYYDRPKRAV